MTRHFEVHLTVENLHCKAFEFVLDCPVSHTQSGEGRTHLLCSTWNISKNNHYWYTQ